MSMESIRHHSKTLGNRGIDSSASCPLAGPHGPQSRIPKGRVILTDN